MQPGTVLFVLITLEIMKGGETGQAWGKNKSIATLSYLKRNPSQGMLVVWQTEGFWERLANSRLQQSP